MEPRIYPDNAAFSAEQLNASLPMCLFPCRFQCSVYTPDKAHLFSKLDHSDGGKAVFDL
jgi:hypothetical protein